MAKTREKLLAKELFLNTGSSQKEIAEKIGVLESTIGKWVKQGGWKDLRSAQNVTRDQLLRDAYRQLDKINHYIQDQGGVPDQNTNNAKSVIVREIQALDKTDSLSMHVAVMEKFLLYVSARNHKLSRQLAPYQLDFLEARSNEAER